MPREETVILQVNELKHFVEDDRSTYAKDRVSLLMGFVESVFEECTIESLKEESYSSCKESKLKPNCDAFKNELK